MDCSSFLKTQQAIINAYKENGIYIKSNIGNEILMFNIDTVRIKPGTEADVTIVDTLDLFKKTYNIADSEPLVIFEGQILEECRVQNKNGRIDRAFLTLLEINESDPADMKTGLNQSNMDFLFSEPEMEYADIQQPEFEADEIEL